MIWLLLILLTPADGQLNVIRPIHSHYTLPICTNNGDIKVYFEIPVEPQNQYTLKVYKEIHYSSRIILRFDSEVSLELIEPTNAQISKFPGPNLRSNQFIVTFTDKTSYLGIQVFGPASGYSIPYVLSVILNDVELCTEPKIGYFNDEMKKPDESAAETSLMDESCGKRKVVHNELVVQGHPTQPGDWPWHAAILRANVSSFRYICGRTLLPKTLDLTATVSTNNVSHKQHHTAIDAFIRRLKLENWEKEEAPCLEKTLTLLENVKNFTLWATWVWNANTVPTGNLYGSWVNFGNFDQCMKPPWLETHPQFKTKYCIAKLVLSDNPKNKADYDPYGSTEEYLNSPTISGLPVNYLLWGMCVPAACYPTSIVKITRSMYDLTTFGTQAPNITVDRCQVAGDKLQYGVGFYLFIALIVLLIVMAAASTYYRLHVACDDQPPDSLKTIITKSFCIIKNRQDLVKDNKEEIRVMNGMRFLTAASVIFVHEILYMVMSGVVNSRDYDKYIEGLGGMLLHLNVVVDTFFAMSGLLHIKGLLGNANRQQNLFSVLWKRYVRLMGPFAIIIFYLISVSKYTGSGPYWIFSNELESEVCLKTWRLSLLMLNTDPKYICHAVTWYVPCDYQLAILGTVLFYLYQKDRRNGFVAFGTAAVLSLIIPGVLTYWYQLPAVPFLDLYKVLHEIRNYWEISYTYTPSYSRAGAYLVGVAMGYLMTLYKPSEYRKTVSKTWSIVGTAISLATMLYILLLGTYYMYREYNPIEAAVITSTNRIAWALAICVIIGLCEYGTVPIVTDILSFSYFTPLSRLSYGIYMIHPLLIQRNKFTLRSPLKFDTFSINMDTIGTLTTAIGLSFVMWLLVEAPLINISNHFLFRKPKSTQPITEPDTIGIQHQNGQIKTKAA